MNVDDIFFSYVKLFEAPQYKTKHVAIFFSHEFPSHLFECGMVFLIHIICDCFLRWFVLGGKAEAESFDQCRNEYVRVEVVCVRVKRAAKNAIEMLYRRH